MVAIHEKFAACRNRTEIQERRSFRKHDVCRADWTRLDLFIFVATVVFEHCTLHGPEHIWEYVFEHRPEALQCHHQRYWRAGKIDRRRFQDLLWRGGPWIPQIVARLKLPDVCPGFFGVRAGIFLGFVFPTAAGWKNPCVDSWMNVRRSANLSPVSFRHDSSKTRFHKHKPLSSWIFWGQPRPCPWKPEPGGVRASICLS